MPYVVKQFETDNYLKLNLERLEILETNRTLVLEYLPNKKLPVQNTRYGELYYDVLGSDGYKYRLKFCDVTSNSSNYKYAIATYKAYNLLEKNTSVDLDSSDSSNLKLLKKYLKEDVWYWDVHYVETLIKGMSDSSLEKIMSGNLLC